MQSKADIDTELKRLQRRLPELMDGRGKDEVLAAFAEEARPLVADPPAEHAAYINRRLNCMLADAGLVAGEAEGEPCPQGED